VTLISKLVRLPPADMRLLATAAVWLSLTRVGLKVLPFRTVRSTLRRLGIPTPLRAKGPSRERIVWAVAVSGRYVPGVGTCLSEALTAQTLLARWGYHSRVRYGLARGETGLLHGHAWLESEGRVMLGGNDAREYTPLASLEEGP
jgi:Transglutaminase-like superfamily